MGAFRREFSRNLWNGTQVQTRSNFVFRVKCPSLLLDRNQTYIFCMKCVETLGIEFQINLSKEAEVLAKICFVLQV